MGGVLSPYLFNMYSSTINTVILSEISINAFAVTIPFKNLLYHARKRKKKTMNMLESKMNIIAEWMGSNQLKMNAGKTELILFGANHQLKKMNSI